MSKLQIKLTKSLLMISLIFSTFISYSQVTVSSSLGTLSANYSNLKASFDAINAGTHLGSIQIGISANTTETAPCVLNSSGAGAASYTSVTISPTVDGIIVSGATTTGRGLVELNGADSVIINGDNANTTGMNRNLTFTNTASSTIGYTSVIRIALAASVVNSANYNTFKNCNLVGNAAGRNISTAISTNGSEHNTYGILVGIGGSTTSATTAPVAITSINSVVALGATATSLTIDNNAITSCARGIAVQSSSTTFANFLRITNNVIGSAIIGSTTSVYSRGITIQGFNNCIVSGNTVQNIGFYVATACQAIALGEISANGTNCTLENNTITGVRNSNATTSSGAYGINIACGPNNVIRNNMISGVTGNMTSGNTFSTTTGIFGIRIAASNGHKIFHNSVSLDGLRPGVSAASLLSAALCIVNTTQTGLDIRNNIFSNTMTGGTTSLAYVSIYLPTLATSAMNLNLNNNVLYSGIDASNGVAQVGSTAGNGFYLAANFIASSTAPATNLRSYTSTLSSVGTNDNTTYVSTMANPFSTTSNLHLSLISNQIADVEQKGDGTVPVTSDIDLDVRPNLGTTLPDIGADEVAQTSCTVVSGGIVSPALFGACQNSSITLSAVGSSSNLGITSQWQVSTVSGGPYANVTGGTGANSSVYITGPLSAGTYYYILNVVCSNGPVIGFSNEVTIVVSSAPPVVVSTISSIICLPGGAPIILTASGALSYTWLPATGLSATNISNPTANPLTTTTYSVTGLDAFGCSATSSITIVVGEKPNIISVSASPSNVCSGSFSQLQSTAANSTNYNLTSIPYVPTLDPGGATIVSGDDDMSAAQIIPFIFYFYGNPYTEVFACTNGFVQLGTNTSSTAVYGQSLPSALAPNNIIAGVFNDLIVFGTAAVRSYTTGTAPNRIFTIHYNNVPFYNVVGNTDWQVQLYETSNIIEVHVGEVTGASATSTFNTLGIENSTGTSALTPSGRNAAAWNVTVAAPEAWRFSPSGGTFNFAWTPSTFLNSSTVTNPLASGITSSITYSVVATDLVSGCATTSSSVAINTGSVLTSGAGATPGTIVCEGSIVTLNALPIGGGAPYTFTWTGPNGFTSLAQNPVIPAITSLGAGTYTVVINDACFTSSTSQVTIATNAAPSFSVSPSVATICLPLGPAVSMNASGSAVSYSWLPTTGLSTSTGSSVSANPSATTTYTVIGADAIGCTSTTTAVVTVSETPSLSAVATPTAVCVGANSQLNALSTLSGLAGYTLSNIAYAPQADPGGASVVTGDDNVSGSLTLPFTFNYFGTDYTNLFVYTNGFVELGSNSNSTFAYGQSIPSTNTPNAIIAGVWADLNVTGAGAVRSFVSGTAPNRIFTVHFSNVKFYFMNGNINFSIQLFEGSNVIEVHVGESSSGTANKTLGIENSTGTNGYSPAGRNFANWSVSVASPEAWRFTPNGGPITYNWTASTLLNSTTISNPIASALNSTTTWTVTATNGINGCVSDSAIVTVTVEPLSPLTFISTPSQSVCEGTSVTISPVITGGGSPYLYTWLSGQTTSTISVNPTSTTTYSLSVADVCGATRNSSITINVNSLPLVVSSPLNSVYCNPGTAVNITASGAATYVWSPSVGLSSSLGNSVDASPTTNTTYTVLGTDTNGCQSSSTVNISVADGVDLTSVTAAPSTICSGQNTVLTASATVPVGIYCQPVTSCVFPDIISNVSFGGINRSSACDGAGTGGYTIYNSPNPSFVAGVVVPLSVTTSGDIEGSAVWIDFNHNGVFDPAELVQNGYLGTNPATYNASVTIPLTAYNGITRMRVRCTYFSNPNSVGPCANVIFGETEDYLITITGGIDPVSYFWSPSTFLNNTTASTVSALAMSTGVSYSVIVTSGSGCTATGTASVTVNPTPLAPIAVSDTICTGTASSITATSVGTLGWYDALTGGNYLAGGSPLTTSQLTTSITYFVQDSSALGCISPRTTVQLTVNPSPVVNLGSNLVQCANQPQIILNALNLGSTYLWSNSATTQIIAPSVTGYYAVTVTTPLGCIGRDTVSITINPVPVVAFGPDITFCGSAFSLDAQNPGATYLWNNFSNSQILNAVSSGSYNVIVTNVFGCVGSDTISVTLNVPAVVNLGNDTVLCGGNIILDAQNAGNTFLWNDNSTSSISFVSSSGSFWVDVTTLENCTTRDSIQITINTWPVVSLGADVSFCVGNFATLDAGSISGASYLWNGLYASQTLNVSTGGMYYVTATTGPNCSAADTIFVVVNPLPVVNLGNDTTICGGGNVTLNALNAGSSYLWNDLSTSQTLVVNSSGTYIVSVSTNANCLESDTVVVLVNALPNVSLALSIDTTCSSSNPIALDGGLPLSGIYSGTSVSGSNFDPSIGAGTYLISYDYTDSNGCLGSATQNIFVDVCLSVNDGSLNNLLVYPNPTNSLLFIETGDFGGKAIAELFNSIGQLIQKNQLNASTKNILDVSGISNGIYILKVTKGSDVKNIRVSIGR